MPFYTRSNGTQVDITTMPFPHLRSAAEKLRRDGDPNGELPAMDEELAQRAIVYRAELESKVNDPTLTGEERDAAAQALAKLDEQA